MNGLSALIMMKAGRVSYRIVRSEAGRDCGDPDISVIFLDVVMKRIKLALRYSYYSWRHWKWLVAHCFGLTGQPGMRASGWSIGQYDIDDYWL